MKALKGKTILITGGTSGIGKALAESLKNHNKVIVTNTNPAKVASAREAGFVAVQCDLTSVSDIESLVTKIEQEHPELDVLVNNAGIQYNYDFIKEPDLSVKIHREIQTNLTGTVQLTQMLIPVLSTKASMIINVTSALGAVPKSDGLVYSVSKAGLRNFTIGLKKVLRGENIQVLELVPPVTDTAMTADRDEPKMAPEALVALVLKQLQQGKSLLAPTKVRFLLWLNGKLPALANRIIT